MRSIDKLKQVVLANPQRVIFAEADDSRVIEASRTLIENNLAIPTLLGGSYEIREIAEKNKLSTRGLEIVNPKHQKSYNPFLEILKKEKRIDLFEAEQIARENIAHALLRLKTNQNEIAFAGNKSGMAKVTRTALKIDKIKSGFSRISSYYLLESGNGQNTFAFADCSVNIDPSAETLAEITIKTAGIYFQITNFEPKVALLSFSTKGSAKHKNIDKIVRAVEIIKSLKPDLKCDGELQFDAAIDPVIAQKKAPNGVLNSSANVFIFPTLNSANIAQKIVEQIAGYHLVGPIIQGSENHIHGLPINCTAESIVNTVILASFLKLKKEN